MLVLARHPNEDIYFKNQITQELIRLIVIDVRGNKARIGIEAPEHWKILRGDVVTDRLTEEERRKFLSTEKNDEGT